MAGYAKSNSLLSDMDRDEETAETYRVREEQSAHYRIARSIAIESYAGLERLLCKLFGRALGTSLCKVSIVY